MLTEEDNLSDSGTINGSTSNAEKSTNGIRISTRTLSMSGVPREEDKNEDIVKERTKEIANSYLDILLTIGEDPYRQGLRKTPERAAKALLHFTKGYEEKLEGI
jgi:hypothetical protein